ncbi:Survival motor neuron protein 1-like isoform X2 [Aphelenchoides besseyi]|nr:Survival motor neuron protein 1-like isoform X2 [Aphelenchoides besseyi]
MNISDATVIELYKMSTSEDTNEKVSVDAEEDFYTRSKKKWKEGDACCAYYPDDGMYYPAKIISINGQKVTVLYTEYEGEKQEVNVDQLLSESDVEHPGEEDDFEEETIMEVSTSGTVVYEKPQSSSSYGKKKGSNSEVRTAATRNLFEVFNNHR